MNIFLADYLCYLNDKKEPKGHGKKALKEAYFLLTQSEKTVRCIASPEYCDFTPVTVSLRGMVRSRKNGMRRFMNAYRNIRKSLTAAKNEIIWFTCSDWMLFAALAFSKKQCRIAVTIFRDVLDDTKQEKWGILKKPLYYLVKKGMNRIDVYFVTSPVILHKYPGAVYIPDYYYSSSYEQYRTIKKKEQIVCLGLMHRSKMLTDVVSHFNNTEIKVVIIGDFEDEAYFNEVRSAAGNNILVENRRLNDEEYKKILGESKWVIMPYTESYASATSGILLETVFVNSIPIAPQFLLNHNNIKGIGFGAITDIPTSLDELDQVSVDVKNDVSGYQFNRIRDKVVNAFK